jgi:Protein of unknown function (DUF2442)
MSNNKYIPIVISVLPLDGCKLDLKFEDGVEGIIDLIELKGKGVFEYWNDENNFKNFIVTNMNKLEWNENLDMDPDSFYLKIIKKTYQEFQNS